MASGWRRELDFTTKRAFYIHTATEKCQWTKLEASDPFACFPQDLIGFILELLSPREVAVLCVASRAVWLLEKRHTYKHFAVTLPGSVPAFFAQRGGRFECITFDARERDAGGEWTGEEDEPLIEANLDAMVGTGAPCARRRGDRSPGSRCSINNWITDAFSNTATMGTFAFAQNFDSFLNKSTDMSVGFNTLAQPTFLNMTYPASVTIANRFDTFAHFDALIEIDDAGLRMRY